MFKCELRVIWKCLGTLGIIFEVSAQEVRERADRSPAFSRTIGTTHARPAEPASSDRALQPNDRAHDASPRETAPSDRAHPADRSPIMPIDRVHLPIGRTTAPNDRQTAQFTRASCRSIARDSRSIAQSPSFQSQVTLCVLFESFY